MLLVLRIKRRDWKTCLSAQVFINSAYYTCALTNRLLQLYPGVDFSDELGPPVLRDSWKKEQPVILTLFSKVTMKIDLA